MCSLVDYQIRSLSRNKGLIEPYNEEQQNPASYDVTLSSCLLVEKPIYYADDPHYSNAIAERDGRWLEFDIGKNPYTLRPGEFVLACTEEFIRVPNYLEAVFCLKSSRAREGWEHALAAYIDPGFCGKVTLELKNNNQFNSLEMSAGFKIGQLRFSRLDEGNIPLRPYSVTGRYNNDNTTTPSKG
jgi:dCTP deaminase